MCCHVALTHVVAMDIVPSMGMAVFVIVMKDFLQEIVLNVCKHHITEDDS